MSLNPFPVTYLPFTIGSRINSLTAHAQTLLSCLDFETHSIGQTPSSLEHYLQFAIMNNSCVNN